MQVCASVCAVQVCCASVVCECLLCVCCVNVCCASVVWECAVCVCVLCEYAVCVCVCACAVQVCCVSVCFVCCVNVCCASEVCECAVQVCCVCVLCNRLGCSRAHAILVLPTVPLKQILSNGQKSVLLHQQTLHATSSAPCPHQVLQPSGQVHESPDGWTPVASMQAGGRGGNIW